MLGCFIRRSGEGQERTAHHHGRPSEGETRTEVERELEFAGPLADALQDLSERYQFPIRIDQDAFRKQVGIMDVRNQQVQLARIKKAAVKDVLQTFLDQVHGTYRIYDHKVQIIPR